MVESRNASARIRSASGRSGAPLPRAPRLVRPVSPRVPVDETQDLRPVPAAAPAEPRQQNPSPARRQAPPRSEAERVLLGVLLLCLGLTLGAFLAAEAVTRVDALFAAVVLLSGLALLAAMELSRRGVPPGD